MRPADRIFAFRWSVSLIFETAVRSSIKFDITVPPANSSEGIDVCLL
jgi:hypothetical protein